MTALFDPTDAAYVDEKATRDELTRVFDTCGQCRACIDVCVSFTSLFELLGPADGRDAGRLSPAQQDRVVDQCFQCDACVTACPYAPTRHESAIDVPKTIIRARAMRLAVGQTSLRERWIAAIVARPDRVGRIGTVLPTPANFFVSARPGSVRRWVLRVCTGVTSRRRLPRFARSRFSSRVDRGPASQETGSVVLHPTCLVEYGETTLGDDLHAAYRAGGLECSLSTAGCCGAAALHSGDVGRFARMATRTVRALASEISNHEFVVVGQPECAAALRRHAADHVAPDARSDARLVADRIVDPMAPLRHVGAHLAPGCEVTVAAYEQADGAEAAARALLVDAGATVTAVRCGVGVTSSVGLTAAHDDLVGAQLAMLPTRLVDAAGSVAGSSLLANGAVSGVIGGADSRAVHPVELVVTGVDDPPSER